MESYEHDRDDLALVAECEAFLEGCYAERLIETGDVIPVWAWTNVLAHGTKAQLEQCADVRRRPPAHVSSRWHDARAYLAGEIADAAGDAAELRRLQFDVLIPLEARLADRRSSTLWSPKSWTAAVLAEIMPFIQEGSRRRAESRRHHRSRREPSA